MLQNLMSISVGYFVSLTANTLYVAYCVSLKELRPVLEGFVITMHEGACETGSQTRVLFAQARVHCDNKPR